MTDQLEALLLGQEPEDDEPVWWKDRRMSSLRERRLEWQGEHPRHSREVPAGQPEEPVREPEEQPEKEGRFPAEKWFQEQTQGWTARELERVRRMARRAVQASAGRENAQRNGHRAEPLTGAGALPVLKDSPAAGRQGLTAQIDMQFRRDARRYDGRLGLL